MSRKRESTTKLEWLAMNNSRLVETHLVVLVDSVDLVKEEEDLVGLRDFMISLGKVVEELVNLEVVIFSKSLKSFSVEVEAEQEGVVNKVKGAKTYSLVLKLTLWIQ